MVIHNNIITIPVSQYYHTVEKFLEQNKNVLNKTPYNDVCRFMESEFGIKFDSSNHPHEESWNYQITNKIKFNIANYKYRII